MKALSFLACGLVAASADEVQWPRLAGIVNAANQPAAVLVIPPSASPAFWPPEAPHLHAGESQHGFQVLSIDPASGIVRLTHSKSAATNELKLARLENGRNYALHFEGVPLASAVEIYQTLSGRTVIHSPQLRSAEIDAHISRLERAEVLAELAKALEVHDALLIPRADKYAFAVPARQKALAEAIPAPPTVAAGQVIPAGWIKFTSADVLQVLDFYAQLSKRTVLRPGALVGFRLTFRSQTPLSTEEAAWVIEAALRLGSLVTVPAGDKFVFVVPPKRVNGLPMFDPARQLPGNPGLMNLLEVDRQPLLEAYAALTGLRPLPIDATVPHAKCSLSTPAPLTPAEAAFALEAVAMLNNVAFQPVGDNEVKLVALASLSP